MSKVKLGGQWCAVALRGDITDRRIAEERLQRALADAGRLALEAQAANLAKSQFLANMSHEIRTPMTAVLGYADLLAGALSDPEQVDAVNIIRRNGNHLLAVINDILDLSKIEAGEVRVEQLPVDLPQLLADVVALMRPRADAKGVACRLEFAQPIPETIAADPTRLRQILVNLVGNAVKFTAAGEVRIVAGLRDAETSKPRLQCEVIDTGIGIAGDDIGRIFQPFHQADASTTRMHGGTGLGLWISKRLAKLLGGEIGVRSELGSGSVFTLTIPTGPLAGVALIAEPCAAAAPKQPLPSPAAPSPPDLSHCRILLAEDGPDNQRLVAYILRKAGAEVSVAENGQEALERVQSAGGTPLISFSWTCRCR